MTETTRSRKKAGPKAFAYLRVSGKGQVKGDGFTRQLKAIREYAKAHGIRIARIYREEGVSGTKELENRPALSEMMEALHGNGVKLVLIEKLDRLARDLMIQETIIGDLRKYGFDLISATEPDLLSDDPSRVMFRQFMGAIAQWEKTVIVQKLRGARQRAKAKHGRCEGAKPYGTLRGEAEVVERIRELRAKGLGFDRLAAQLDKEGIKTRRGKRWHGTVVNSILTGKRRVV